MKEGPKKETKKLESYFIYSDDGSSKKWIGYNKAKGRKRFKFKSDAEKYAAEGVFSTIRK